MKIGALFACIFALKCVIAAKPSPLIGHKVAQNLYDVGRAGRNQLGNLVGNIQVAAIQATDRHLNEIHFNAVQYIAPADKDIRYWAHTEVFLVIDMEANLLPHNAAASMNSGYVFLFTHNSPCSSCLCFLLEVAEQHPDVQFYIGYTQPYGRGIRGPGQDGETKQRQFQEMLPATLPSNIHFMYLASEGNVRWVYHHGTRSVKRPRDRRSLPLELFPSEATTAGERRKRSSHYDWQELFFTRYRYNTCQIQAANK